MGKNTHEAKFELEGREPTIVRATHDEDNPYIVTSRETIQDKRLSFKSRGLLIYMLGRPQGWEFNISHLVKMSEKDGRVSIRSALKELEKAGYIKREEVRKSGRFAGIRLLVYETPQKHEEIDEIPHISGWNSP